MSDGTDEQIARIRELEAMLRACALRLEDSMAVVCSEVSGTDEEDITGEKEFIAEVRRIAEGGRSEGLFSTSFIVGDAELVERMAEAIHHHEEGLGDDADWRATYGDAPRKLWKTDAPWDSNPAELAEWQRDDYRAQAKAALVIVRDQLRSRDQHIHLLGDALGRVLVRTGVLRPDVACTGPELLRAAEQYCTRPG